MLSFLQVRFKKLFECCHSGWLLIRRAFQLSIIKLSDVLPQCGFLLIDEVSGLVESHDYVYNCFTILKAVNDEIRTNVCRVLYD